MTYWCGRRADICKTAELLVQQVQLRLDDYAAPIQAALRPPISSAAEVDGAELWLECNECQKWRNVSPRVYEMYKDAAYFCCILDVDRPEAFRTCA
eukprot:scaffold632204_cov24-Prasinocladus_malaysianus.AAC.1